MAPPLPTRSATSGDGGGSGLLGRYAAERATGALRAPNGCVYLREGAVYCVECPAAPGPEARLTAAGRLSARSRQRAAEAAGPQRRGGRFLVEQGWLTQGELEICQLAALLDAAFFVLPLAPGSTTFTPGEGHWLGVVRLVGAAALQEATARRRALLDRLRPWAAADEAPVVPVVPVRSAGADGPGGPEGPAGAVRPAVTGRQRRLLEHADGRHTPYELAHALGQSAYLTLLDVRGLAAAGLIRLPPKPAALPRRRPGASGADRRAAAPGAAPRWHLPDPGVLETADPDVALLVRLRTALEENL
ncbi:hypothetical protein [Streptomyces sp. GS7]|uniref:hypothetical protein n=1 Tax=Streptomyces sp. GS7 TaxID=2692234 RepID=UPI0013193647|nr:hypothetical protein [Streptomyces sp. GS7]QHC24121.1 hypothetical protein GR130_24840 [Streptomyces sp. GS7]